MLNKIKYYTDNHTIEIQRFKDEWILYVFTGMGGARLVESGDFINLSDAMNYVSVHYGEVNQ